MRKLLLSAFAGLFAVSAAYAGSVALFPSTTPLEPSQIQATLNQLINLINAQIAPPDTTCTGTTTATCQGAEVLVSITGLTTAASTLSATMTVTDASAVVATPIVCQVNGYAGTGIPVAVNVVPTATGFTYAIQNVSTGAALNATVTSFCKVYTQ